MGHIFVPQKQWKIELSHCEIQRTSLHKSTFTKRCILLLMWISLSWLDYVAIVFFVILSIHWALDNSKISFWDLPSSSTALTYRAPLTPAIKQFVSITFYLCVSTCSCSTVQSLLITCVVTRTHSNFGDRAFAAAGHGTATSQRCWLSVEFVPAVIMDICFDSGPTAQCELFYLRCLEIILLTYLLTKTYAVFVRRLVS